MTDKQHQLRMVVSFVAIVLLHFYKDVTQQNQQLHDHYVLVGEREKREKNKKVLAECAEYARNEPS
jgi:hypothetical protein